MSDKPLTAKQVKAMFAALDEARANELWRKAQTEKTDAGEQVLIPGVAPITDAERLKRQLAATLTPAATQKPCNHGLFDDGARDQLDLVELTRKGAKK